MFEGQFRLIVLMIDDMILPIRSATLRPRPRFSRARHVLIFSAFLFVAAGSQPAAAETPITSDLTTNTTWTAAGSPYVLLRPGITVKAGATLTLEPGVTVEFAAGETAALYVAGTLSAVGTADAPITFTSSQGADGAGAPGQYRGVIVAAGTGSRFSYTRFYYGGYGSGGYWAYAALTLNSKNVAVTVDHSTFQHNRYSGMLVGSNAVATVSDSTFSQNGNGISALVTEAPGTVTLTHNTIVGNVQDGLFFSNASSFTTPGPTVMGNEITANGRYGIQIQQWCSAPSESFPHGNGNNIYGNGNPQDPADGSELHTMYTCPAKAVDWTGNYWGAVSWRTGPKDLEGPRACSGGREGPPLYWWRAGPMQAAGYLGYSAWNDPTLPNRGPISTNRNFGPYMQVLCPGPGGGSLVWLYIWDVHNSFFLGPDQFVTSPLPAGAGAG